MPKYIVPVVDDRLLCRGPAWPSERASGMGGARPHQLRQIPTMDGAAIRLSPAEA